MKLALLVALILARAVSAQDSYDGLRRPAAGAGTDGAAPSVAAGKDATAVAMVLEGRPLEVRSVSGGGIDFRIGRDNAGFCNPAGAVQMGGMAGNCYTMAFVTKLFFEGARFEPSEGPAAGKRGCTNEDLQAWLEAGRRGRFLVRDFASFHDMTWDEDFGSARAFAWLRAQNAVDTAVGSGDSGAPPSDGRERAIVRLVQLVTAIHYLHYLQSQGANFVESLLRTELAGTGQMRSITRRELASIRSELDRGKTCLLLMFNSVEAYGHVVLAYRVQSTADADYVFVCDSNVQCDTEKRECVLAVSKKGEVLDYYTREPGGKLERCAIYDTGSDWFTRRSSLGLLHLEELPLGREDLAGLARKAAVTDQETAWLMVAGELLRGVTGQTPDESTLREDLTRFMRNASALRAAQGEKLDTPLPAGASVAEMNRFLGRYADLAVRVAHPYALPPGISLSLPRLVLSDSDPNRARISCGVAIEKSAAVDRLAAAVAGSAALAGQPDLAAWVAAARGRLGNQKVRVWIDADLVKRKQPAGAKTRAMLHPIVHSVHVVIGDMLAGRAPADGEHRIEISEPAMAAALEAACDATAVLGKRFEQEYVLVPEVQAPGGIVITPEVRRKVSVRLDTVSLDLIPGGYGKGLLDLTYKGYAFVECNPLVAGKGISFTNVKGYVQLFPDREARWPSSDWALHVEAAGFADVDDGLLNLAFDAASALSEQVFPFVKDLVNDAIRDRLNRWVKLKEPIGIDSVSLKAMKGMNRYFKAKATRAVIDVTALCKQLFALPATVVLSDVDIQDDRLVLTGRILP